MSYGSRKRGLCPRGVWPPFVSGVRHRARHKHFVILLCEQWTMDAAVSARRLPPFVAALFFTLRDSYGWQHCRPVYSEARYLSRIAFFCLSHLHLFPLLGGFPSEYRHPVWYGKTRMVGLPDGEQIWKICLFVLTWSTNVTDTQTLHDSMGCHAVAQLQKSVAFL